MKIALVYVAVTHGQRTADFASRFVATYKENPPGVDHSTVIACNGGPLPLYLSLIFESLHPQFFPRTNTPDYDIGAYLQAARGPCADSDMMVCLGESIYFHRPGWLARLVEVWKKHGPGMYGSFTSNLVRPHINTTGFCTATKFLSQCKSHIYGKNGRYEFEHGKNAFWRQLWNRQYPAMLVTWDGEYSPQDWRKPNNILWKGDQSNCLMFCSHTDRYRSAKLKTKLFWEQSANAPFK